MAHVEVLDVHADRTMDVRVLRVLHGREDRPVVSVDARSTLGWNMAQQWGFKPFSAGTQWLIVMRPAQTKHEAWQTQLCRAYLKVEGGSAVGYVSDLAIRERVTVEDLSARVASVTPGLP